jgi:hypothetical protein
MVNVAWERCDDNEPQQLKRRATQARPADHGLQNRPALLADASPRPRLPMREGSGRVEPDVSSFGITDGCSALLHDRAHVRFSNPSQALRAGRNQKRRIGFGDGVQMNAQRHRLRQDIAGRRDVQETALDRPRTKARDLATLRDRDRPILMPRHGPVGSSRLVKESRLDRAGRIAKRGGCQSTDRRS